MGRYLELAKTVVSRQEPMNPAVSITGEKPNFPPASSNSGGSYLTDKQEAHCGSPACAGCYDVGDGRKIHPPKCGHDYLDWLKRWEPKGQKQ